MSMSLRAEGALLDTSIVIRYFRRDYVVAELLESFSNWYLPHAALAELYAGAYNAADVGNNLSQVERFLTGVGIIFPDHFTLQL